MSWEVERDGDTAMVWTWRRTAIGLVIAVTLGLLAGIVFLIDDQRRRQIVDHGIRTAAVVTADHNDEWDHWYTVTYRAEGRDRSANLRSPWVIDKIPVGQSLTVYIDPDHPSRISTANGYATPVWTSTPGWLAVLAIFAAFITIAGRLFSARSARPAGR